MSARGLAKLVITNVYTGERASERTEKASRVQYLTSMRYHALMSGFERPQKNNLSSSLINTSYARSRRTLTSNFI